MRRNLQDNAHIPETKPRYFHASGSLITFETRYGNLGAYLDMYRLVIEHNHPGIGHNFSI